MKKLSAFFLLICLLIAGGGAAVVAQDKKKEYVSPPLGGVPVFQGGKDEKTDPPMVKDDKTPAPKVKNKEDSPPAVLPGEEGRLPLKFVSNKIVDMAVGDKGYIPANLVKVDYDRICYIDIHTTVLSSVPTKRETMVEITKDDAGYHIGISETLLKHKWHAEDDGTTKGWTQVKTVKLLKAAASSE